MRTRLTTCLGILLAMLMAMAMLGCAAGQGRRAQDDPAAASPVPDQEELEDAVIATRLQGFLMEYEKVEAATVQIDGLTDSAEAVYVTAELVMTEGQSLSEQEQEAIMNVILSAVPQVSEENVTLNWE